MKVYALIVLCLISIGCTRTDVAEPGYMSQILVTAPRYGCEDSSWSGMLEEIVVTAPRVPVEHGDHAPKHGIDVTNIELPDMFMDYTKDNAHFSHIFHNLRVYCSHRHSRFLPSVTSMHMNNEEDRL